MALNVRTRTDTGWLVTGDGSVLLPSEWGDLERKVANSWNGDKGAAYQPTLFNGGLPWVFTGAGLQVTGPTRLTYGGAIRGGAGAFVIRDGAWPELGPTHSARTRSIVCPIDTFSVPPPFPGNVTTTQWSHFYMWSRRHPYAGIGSVALAMRHTDTQTLEQPEFYTPLRVIDGAELLSVRIYFRVATQRTYAPIAMPKMRILRVPKNSGDALGAVLPEPLKSAGNGFDFLPLVTTADAWYNEGNVQTFDYVCDQNNVIDVENYSYVVHVIEEQGAIEPNAPFDGVRLVERKTDVAAVVINSGSLSFSGVQAADGTTTGTERALVVDLDSSIESKNPQASSPGNGIWIPSLSGAWARAADCDDLADFTPNWVVLVNTAFVATINQATLWQCQFPTNQTPINFGKTQIRMVPAEPKGNIYHALVPTFGVRDLRFQ